jgi:hypothetical protein
VKFYSDQVTVDVKSAISGTYTETVSLEQLKTSEIGVLREWANDDDLQYLRICSTNIGFVRTYEKQREIIEGEGME